MHEALHTHIAQLEDHHISAVLENMTTHALLSALLTGHELEEHEMLDLMNDHIQEIVNA